MNKPMPKWAYLLMPIVLVLVPVCIVAQLIGFFFATMMFGVCLAFGWSPPKWIDRWL